MSKYFVVHGGILLLPPYQIARYRVVVNLSTKRSGGSESKPPQSKIDVSIELLNDGFFSFAVVRQINCI